MSASWGHLSLAWAYSRWFREFLVDSGMAGMGAIVAAGPACPLWSAHSGANYRCVVPLEARTPKLRAVPIGLRACERAILKRRGGGHKTAHRDRLRARVILLAARDRPNAQIAARLGITEDTVRKWRGGVAGRGGARPRGPPPSRGAPG